MSLTISTPQLPSTNSNHNQSSLLSLEDLDKLLSMMESSMKSLKGDQRKNIQIALYKYYLQKGNRLLETDQSKAQGAFLKAIEHSIDSSTDLANLGRSLYIDKYNEIAAAVLNAVIKKYPDESLAWGFLADYHFVCKRLDECTKTINNALAQPIFKKVRKTLSTASSLTNIATPISRTQMDYAELYAIRAVCLFEQEKKEDAARTARISIQANPFCTRALVVLTKTSNDPNEIKDSTLRLEARTTMQDPNSSRTIYQKAEIAATKGNLAEATALYMQLISDLEYSFYALSALYRMAYKQEKHDDAFKWALSLTQQHPEKQDSIFRLLSAYPQMKISNLPISPKQEQDFENALLKAYQLFLERDEGEDTIRVICESIVNWEYQSLYEKLIAPLCAKNSLSYNQRYCLAILYFQTEKYDQAETYLEKLKTEKCDDVKVLFYLGKCAIQKDNSKKAISSLESALELKPTDVGIRELLSLAYYSNQEYTESLALSSKTLKESPSYFHALYNNCRALCALGNYSEAVTAIVVTLIQCPSENESELQGLLGTAYFFLKQYNKAKAVLLKLTQFDCSDANVWLLLGKTHCMLGELKEAKSAYNTVCNLDPNNATPRIELARIYASQDKKESALDCYQQVCIINQTFPIGEIYHVEALLYRIQYRQEENKLQVAYGIAQRAKKWYPNNEEVCGIYDELKQLCFQKNSPSTH